MSDNDTKQELAIPQKHEMQLAEMAALIPVRYKIDAETIFNIQLMAPFFHQCRWYGTSSESQVIAVMLKAAGLGIPPSSAFDFFDIVEGRPGLKPIGAMALMQRSGNFDIAIDRQWDYCAVTIRRRDNGFEYTSVYTVEDAIRSRLFKDGTNGTEDKPNSAWRRFTRDLLYNRALGACAKIAASDVMYGVTMNYDLEDAARREPYAIIDAQPNQPRLTTEELAQQAECDHLLATNVDTICPSCGAQI